MNMGTSVSFSCECGFKGYSLIGGGRMTFREVNLFPAYCERCKDVVEINLYADLKCPKCAEPVVPYTDRSLLGSPGDRNVVNWGDLTLTNGAYKCPKCGKMSLHFEDGGGLLWD
jgi:Zn finger protein HypA/HybF involved in hydrogenase expression